MVSSLHELNFDKVVNAVQAEIARRSISHNMQQPNDNNTPQPNANLAQRSSSGSRGRGRGRGRNGRRVGQRGTFGGHVENAPVTISNVQLISTMTVGNA